MRPSAKARLGGQSTSKVVWVLSYKKARCVSSNYIWSTFNIGSEMPRLSSKYLTWFSSRLSSSTHLEYTRITSKYGPLLFYCLKRTVAPRNSKDLEGTLIYLCKSLGGKRLPLVGFQPEVK